MKNEGPVQLSDLYAVALEAALAARDIINSAAEQPKQIDYKGATDLVTATDRESEAVITGIIRRQFPDHQILAEESGRTNHKSDYVWLIDPLDGTTNFVHGYPSYAVSIGIAYQENLVCGVIVELPVNHVYHAIRGLGAFCDNQPISVSNVSELGKSLLVTGFGYVHDAAWQANMELFKHFTDLTQGVRRLGAAAVDFAHLASGKVDGFWEFNLHPWDTAAGVLLVEEAGGNITRMDGEKYSVYDKQMLASNGCLHSDLLKNIAAIQTESSTRVFGVNPD
ncbi:MAG: inositol monophosphatase [Candidatus Marinimicrobia bacterium]|nr:inositol monophosphatase [Candidatus Neomarinimicrobiota bacterium]